MRETKHAGLLFVKFHLKLLRMVLFTDATFANDRGYKLKLGCVIHIYDENNNGNIVHFGSARYKLAVSSVLAAELHTLSRGYENDYFLRQLASEIIGHRITFEAYPDSKTLFDMVTKDAATSEKSVWIDSLGIRESFKNGELDGFGWVPRKQNPFDTLTKQTHYKRILLEKMMNTNKLNISATEWEHSKPVTTDETTRPMVRTSLRNHWADNCQGTINDHMSNERMCATIFYRPLIYLGTR